MDLHSKLNIPMCKFWSQKFPTNSLPTRVKLILRKTGQRVDFEAILVSRISTWVSTSTPSIIQYQRVQDWIYFSCLFISIFFQLKLKIWRTNVCLILILTFKNVRKYTKFGIQYEYTIFVIYSIIN